jgi:hypothetical protein
VLSGPSLVLLFAVPIAVLAAITVKVGFDILDWCFLGRAHHVSRSATLIMYGVLVLPALRRPSRVSTPPWSPMPRSS